MIELINHVKNGSHSLGPTLSGFNTTIIAHAMRITKMFRGKTFQLSLPGNSYRIFIEGLKSRVTKAAHS